MRTPDAGAYAVTVTSSTESLGSKVDTRTLRYPPDTEKPPGAPQTLTFAVLCRRRFRSGRRLPQFVSHLEKWHPAGALLIENEGECNAESTCTEAMTKRCMPVCTTTNDGPGKSPTRTRTHCRHRSRWTSMTTDAPISPTTEPGMSSSTRSSNSWCGSGRAETTTARRRPVDGCLAREKDLFFALIYTTRSDEISGASRRRIPRTALTALR